MSGEGGGGVAGQRKNVPDNDRFSTEHLCGPHPLLQLLPIVRKLALLCILTNIYVISGSSHNDASHKEEGDDAMGVHSDSYLEESLSLQSIRQKRIVLE